MFYNRIVTLQAETIKKIEEDSSLFTAEQLKIIIQLVKGEYYRHKDVVRNFSHVEVPRGIITYYSECHLINVGTSNPKRIKFMDAPIPAKDRMLEDYYLGEEWIERARVKRDLRAAQGDTEVEMAQESPSQQEPEETATPEEEIDDTEECPQEDDFHSIEALSKRTVFDIRPVGDLVREMNELPPLRQLYGPFFYENECAILFADSNVGKSILPVQIGEKIASEIKESVVYFDFELSERQFGQRYGKNHVFPNNFIRAQLSLDRYNRQNGVPLESALIGDIEHISNERGAKVAIIDNLTYICMQAESGAEAGQLMRRLLEMKRRLNLALLVVAHTPKRLSSEPLTQNSLAGSKRIANFADSIFAMGSSNQSADIRYLKQVKSRNGAIVYDADNIILGHIESVDDALRFVEDGYGVEYQHLRTPEERGKGPDPEILARVRELKMMGRTTRDIAEEIGVSHVTVSKYLRRNDR